MELQVQPLTAAAFVPYGEVIGAPAGGARATVDVAQAAGGHGAADAAHERGLPVRAINGGTSLRFDMPGGLDLQAQGGQPCVAVFRARARALAGPWRLLERHRLGSQTFIPLGGVRSVVLVALGNPAPDPATLAAFTVAGSQGFTLHADTWHHGLIALVEGDFVVIERCGDTVDCEFAELEQPVTLHV